MALTKRELLRRRAGIHEPVHSRNRYLVQWSIIAMVAAATGAAAIYVWHRLYYRLFDSQLPQKLYVLARPYEIHSHYIDRTYMAIGVIGIVSIAWLIGATISKAGRRRLTLCTALGVAAVLTYLLIVYLMGPQMVPARALLLASSEN